METLLAFVFDRNGWLGRPVSMLSFLIDGQTWPTDPKPFKHTNILLHLLNGVLIFTLTRQLAALFLEAPRGRKVEYIALATFAIWLLHPMHISASMQVVQRMTLLMSAFTLGGLILYTYGRMHLQRGEAKTGYFWMSVGIGLFGVLATLSKENGILVALYALVIEFTAFRQTRHRVTLAWKLWIGVFCLLPLAGLAVYVGYSWEGMLHTYEYGRTFGPVERLLSQAPILVEYLQGMLIPRASELGLFHDDHAVSRSLLTPWYTLPAVLFILVLGAAGFALIRRAPLVSFAVLWFLAGHVLESTVIPLELYYEHRNYLPMFGIIFAVACGVSSAGHDLRRIVLLGGAAFLIMEALVGLQTTYTWGKPGVMATVWARENPESSRAQQYAAQYWASEGFLTKGYSHIQQAIIHNPRMASLHLQRTLFGCYLGISGTAPDNTVLAALRISYYDTAVFDALGNLQEAAVSEKCEWLELDDIDKLTRALMENEHFSNNTLGLQKLTYRQAQIRTEQRDLDGAMAYLDETYAIRPNRNVRIEQARLLASAGLYCEAQRFVDKALGTEPQRFKMYQLSETELRELRRYLADEASNEAC
ncbi:hypothetical protein [Algiphilus aromaticivorans]|uniref:hypothetical protein n=1 Tax=Algiphilus aromaticivorans TaxID=382454 RepID=UPI0005C1FCD1|nr:hypothetical protein [Algiphilus aromaticivorans]